MFDAGKIWFFGFLFIILTISTEGQMDDDDMRPQKQFNKDVTHDLTNNDLKLALSDFSLDDLRSLQEFIDSENYNDLDYQENDLKFDTYDVDHPEFDHVSNSPDEDEYSLGAQGIENDIMYYPKDRKRLEKFSQENQRSKRDGRKSSTNEEYIKQLDYSFPQNEQKNGNDLEFKKSHIRVKRN